MRLLAEQDYYSSLLDRDTCRLVHRYAHLLLFNCVDAPTDLPQHVWQRVDNKPLMVNGLATCLHDGEFEFAEHPHTLLKFIGPIDTLWLQQLKAAGVQLHFFCPPFGVCAGLPDVFRTAAALVSAFPFFCSATPYVERHCSRGLSHDREKMQDAGLPTDACDLVFFSREDRARVADELASNNVEIIDSSHYKVRLRYSDSLRQLREIPGVKLVDHSRPMQLCANEDLNTAVARPVAAMGGSNLRGRGQVIAVADTGLDKGVNDESLHPDFRGRVKAIVSLPLNQSWHGIAQHSDSNDGASDRNSSHGTHVAGLALGNGVRSGGLHQGVAPEAELVFQAIEQYVDVKDEHSNEHQSGYYLSGRPLDLGELFEQAREFGARIHVNAWGDETRGSYTDDCYEADHFLQQHPDALVLFAAGNSGSDRDGNRVLDMQSLFSPASAKNVIAVGATEGGIEGIGLRVNWGAFDANRSRFRASADRNDAISGEAERIALFSSAGPSKDGRIKPDVCAPGTNLVAPRSRLSAGKGWGLASPLPHYMYNGGTSMAVGVAGGAAAVLREAWEHHNGQPPSGQALKALLVMSAAPVLSRRDDSVEPVHVGGFGRIQIALALPQSESHKITLVDEHDHSLLTGEMREFPITLNQKGHLRAVLCWYDPPGETLINNLDLCLIEPSGERVWGNHRPGERGQADGLNTVETIDINDLPTGRYTLRVIAANVPVGPQSFSLAISQPLSQGLDLPLAYLRGVGTRLNQRFDTAGIHTIGQLSVRPEVLNEITGLSSGVQQQLHARLSVLAQVREALNKFAFDLDNVSVNKLLNGKKPSAFPQAEWLALKEQCLPLILVFNKRALSKISLPMLRG